MKKFEIRKLAKKWLWIVRSFVGEVLRRVIGFADKWLINNTALLIFLIILSIGLVVGHILFWDWFAQLDEKGNLLAPNSEIIRNAALMFAGIWGFYGVVVAARRVAIQERGQVAERYARAAEQLDSESESVRMMAVLALQKIAKEADEETFRNIIKTFCAYIKENRPIEENESKKFPTYLQTVIDFLGTIDDKKREFRVKKPTVTLVDILINLSHSDLTGVDFEWKNFSNSNFQHACLRKALFRAVNLNSAEMLGADLQDADMPNADLRDASMSGTKLQKASMLAANLSDADLFGANLQETDLTMAFLVKTSLQRANLKQAILFRANLSKSELEGADMEEANLTRANLENAQLGESWVPQDRKWNKKKTNLKGAKFRDANTTNIQGLDKVVGIEDVIDPTPEIIAEIERRNSASSHPFRSAIQEERN
ncbi:MAG: pentapeptide repeat-containing protein [Candidatus Dadabacteria bacterium]|nr:pentapeptide repeat-containing protein [Candidatus Dadabacteria bacterium]